MDNEKAYNQLLEKWGNFGAIRGGLSFDTAVDFLVNVMETKDLQIISGASKVTISRAKHKTGGLRLEHLQRIYQFYKDVASMPVKNHDIPADELIPLYSKSDVIECLDAWKNTKDQIDVLLNNAFRMTQRKIKEIRDDAPKQRLDVQKFLKAKENAESDLNNENSEEEKKVPEVHEVKNLNGEIYLTNDYREFFKKPKVDLNSIMESMGYVNKYRKDFKYLTLRQRYLLEFMALVQQTPVSQNDKYDLEDIKNVQLPRTFWKLHALLGKDDNCEMREKNLGRKISKSKPEFNNIEDAIDWVKSIDNWLAHHTDINDPNNDHSAEHNHIDLSNN